MNRPIIYLSGPIANCTLEQIHRWRDQFTRTWGEEYVRDPTRRKYYSDMNYSHAAEIVENDKHDIEESDIVLVNISDPPVGHQMWGTPMEIIWSWDRSKQVYIITDDPSKLSPWVIYHSHEVFKSLKDVLTFLVGKYGPFEKETKSEPQLLNETTPPER